MPTPPPIAIPVPATVEERAEALVQCAQLLSGGHPPDTAHLLSVAVMKLAFAQEDGASCLSATIKHLQRALDMATAALEQPN